MYIYKYIYIYIYICIALCIPQEFLRNPIGILLESWICKCPRNIYNLFEFVTILQVRWLYFIAACKFAPNH